jgi:hypothetical protein
MATKFQSWQTRPGDDWLRPPFESCSPNLLLLRDHLVDGFGGQDLGCHGNRDVRDGGSISSHAYGAAFDWRYQNPGPGRTVLLYEIIPFLIANSAELGIQAIHDYAGCRIWRPPGTSGRPVIGDCWKKQRKSGNMGAAWALWIHVETHPDNFGDTTPIADRLTRPETGDDNMITLDTPVRMLDTRTETPNPLPSGTWTQTVPSTIPANASAIFATVTVIGATSDGFITLWGSGDWPETSNLNYTTAPGAVCNTTLTRVVNGKFQLFNRSPAHIILDVVAYTVAAP